MPENCVRKRRFTLTSMHFALVLWCFWTPISRKRSNNGMDFFSFSGVSLQNTSVYKKKKKKNQKKGQLLTYGFKLRYEELANIKRFTHMMTLIHHIKKLVHHIIRNIHNIIRFCHHITRPCHHIKNKLEYIKKKAHEIIKFTHYIMPRMHNIMHSNQYIIAYEQEIMNCLQHISNWTHPTNESYTTRQLWRSIYVTLNTLYTDLTVCVTDDAIL